MPLLILLLLLTQDAPVPYKPAGEFDVKIDFQLKQRPSAVGSNTRIEFGETWEQRENKKSGVPAQYLALKITLLKLSVDEVKVRITDVLGASVYHKKASLVPILLNVGFMADIKGGLSTHDYELVLVSAKKIPVSRIHILIEKDGTYQVNGVRYGKF